MRFLALGVLACLALLPPAHSQSHELYLDRGAVGMSQSLKRLPLISRVLFVMAHPDDEPAGLVTYVSRGLQAETAILSLTRGEGGQNLVGSDLFDALGLVRTGEMLAADEYYGVRQYFSRAFDFGFSKSAEETLGKWGRDRILEDLVRTIRSFRPHVIISVFSGTAADGHGHHQASGRLAREAYGSSGDIDRFPELTRQGLPPWKADRLYLGNAGGGDPESDSIDLGAYDPWLGASFQQVGARGYSHHRSQGMGQAHALPGSYRVRLHLGGISELPRFSLARDASFKEVLNLKLTDLAGLVPAGPKRDDLRADLKALEAIVERAQGDFAPDDFSRCMPALTEGIKRLRTIQQDWAEPDTDASGIDDLRFFLNDKKRDFLDALRRASGLSLRAFSDAPLLTPGQSFRITVKVVNQSRQSHQFQAIQVESELLVPRPIKGPFPLLKGSEEATFELSGKIPSSAQPIRPPWRRPLGTEDVYTFDDPKWIGAPLLPPLIKVRLCYEYRGEPLEIERPVEFLEVDRLKGTRRIPIHLVPPVRLEVTPPLHLVPLATSGQPRTIQVRVRNNSRETVQGKLKLQTPQGWKCEPQQVPFALPQSGQTTGIRFRVWASSETVKPGRTAFEAVAAVDGREITQQYRMISVFDRWNTPLYSPARSEVEALDLRMPDGLKIGYIMGAGDKVSDTLEQLGMSVTPLTAQDLTAGELGSYDCIIAGIRAYQVRSDLVEHNSRLLDYVHHGGVFIVQYHTPTSWNRSQYAPYPARIVDRGHRITDENAPVTLLAPTHRVFHYPNRITPEDFSGWVQERGLYFIQERDARFQALLASHDPGEAPLDGGLLVADYGEGHYVLTSYSWFRQLPAGVAGAIRLFTNLVSLGSARKEAP